MNQEPTEKPSLVSKDLAFGEKLIYRCKVHKGVWIIPLIAIIGCYTFTLSFPDSKSISSAWFLLVLFFIFFLYTLWLYNGTELILTNQRILIKKSFEIDYIELNNIGILKSKDAMDLMKDRVDGTDYYEDSYNSQYEKNNFMRSVFSFYLDMVKVIIIDKNGQVYSMVDYIGAYNYKQLKKLYDEECEKRDNIEEETKQSV